MTDHSGGSGGSGDAHPRTLQRAIDEAIGSRDLGEIRAALHRARGANSPLVGRLEEVERGLAEAASGLGSHQRRKLWRHYQRRRSESANGLSGEGGSWSPTRRVEQLKQQLQRLECNNVSRNSRNPAVRADPHFWRSEPGVQTEVGPGVHETSGAEAEGAEHSLGEGVQRKQPRFASPGRYRSHGLPGSPAGFQYEAARALFDGKHAPRASSDGQNDFPMRHSLSSSSRDFSPSTADQHVQNRLSHSSTDSVGSPQVGSPQTFLRQDRSLRKLRTSSQDEAVLSAKRIGHLTCLHPTAQHSAQRGLAALQSSGGPSAATNDLRRHFRESGRRAAQLLAAVTDTTGVTPLMHAAKDGRHGCAKLLLEYGGPLEYLAESSDSVEAFCSADAQLDPAGFGSLHLACAHGHSQVVRLLLAQGANPERLTAAGSTPLMLASRHGHKEVCCELLGLGGTMGRCAVKAEQACSRAAQLIRDCMSASAKAEETKKDCDYATACLDTQEQNQLERAATASRRTQDLRKAHKRYRLAKQNGILADLADISGSGVREKLTTVVQQAWLRWVLYTSTVLADVAEQLKSDSYLRVSEAKVRRNELRKRWDRSHEMVDVTMTNAQKSCEQSSTATESLVEAAERVATILQARSSTDGASILQQAAAGDHAECVALLLQYGAASTAAAGHQPIQRALDVALEHRAFAACGQLQHWFKIKSAAVKHWQTSGSWSPWWWMPEVSTVSGLGHLGKPGAHAAGDGSTKVDAATIDAEDGKDASSCTGWSLPGQPDEWPSHSDILAADVYALCKAARIRQSQVDSLMEACYG